MSTIVGIDGTIRRGMPAEPLTQLDRNRRFPPTTVLGALALAAVIAATYSNSLRGPLVLDDMSVVRENDTIRDIRRLDHVLTPPQNGSPVQGRPVANLSFALNYALGGDRVVGYHLFNLTLHFFNCLLLFGLVRQTLRLPRINPSLAQQSTWIAFAAALLWAVHPLATAAVNYISQRTELLASLFYLLTLYCVIRGAVTQTLRRWLFNAGAVAACALGMASKETMATAPLVALLLERTFAGGPWRDWIRRRGWTYLALAATWVPLATLVIRSGTRSGTAGLGAGSSPWLYLLTQCDALLIYLKLQFWPRPLVFDYGPALVSGLRDVWRQALVVVALLAATAILLWRYPRIGVMAAAWFLILAPSSSIVPVRTQTIAEHRAYLPLAVTLTGVTIAMATVLKRPLWAFATLVVVALCLGLVTHRRNAVYASDVGLWNDTLAKRPSNPRAYLNLAALSFLPRGEHAAAINYFDTAIRLDPEFFEAYVNRSSTYVAVGDTHRALADANEAVRLKPDNPQAYLARAGAYELLGENERSIQDCTTALRLNPNAADAYYDRGNGYVAINQFAMAISDYDQAIRLKPGEAVYHFNRGNAYFRLGNFDRAIADYDRAAQIHPSAADVFVNRGIAQAARGQHEQAIADFTRGAQLNPAWPAPYLNRASSYAALGKYDDAWRDVREVRRRGGTPHPEFIRTLSAASGRGE